MKNCKANKPFDDETLKNMDIIHDPNTKFFKDQYEPSYSIQNFITEQERVKLLDFWYKEYNNVGWEINGHIVNIPHPIRYSVINDILRSKVYEHFGDDMIFYSVISNDPVSVGDQMFKSIRPYGLHTDSVTHIPGYRPYKDIIIPLEIHNNVSIDYVTFNQRYRGRATHFMQGRHIPNFSPYSNTFRLLPYEQYGVEGVEYDKLDWAWMEREMPDRIPMSIYEGLSIEAVLPWKLCSGIVQDTSVLHAPTDFQKKGAEWKIAITFHLMVKDETYNNEMIGYPTKLSRYSLNPPVLEI